MLKSQIEKLQAEISLLKSQLRKAENDNKDLFQHKMNSSSFSDHVGSFCYFCQTFVPLQLNLLLLTELEKIQTDLSKIKEGRGYSAVRGSVWF